jgi:hypothetical protein
VGTAPIRLHIAGRHNVKNALAATACALAAGVSLAAVAQGLVAFEPVKGRSRARQISVADHAVTLVDDSYNANPDSVQAAIDRSPRRDYRLTFVGNVLDQKTAMARSTEPGQSLSVETPLAYDWPDQVFSLSHMAIPFALDDPIYGMKAPPAADGLMSLGAMAVRGEKGIFAVASADQLRMKSNPFFGLVKSRILETIDSDRTSR